MTVRSVYIGTSVFEGGNVARLSAASKAFFTDCIAGKYYPLISDIDALELTDSAESVRAMYAAVTNLGFSNLEMTESVSELAEIYIEHKIFDHAHLPEALHLAIASIGGADMLVTWNADIISFEKKLLANSINFMYNYNTVQIFTPGDLCGPAHLPGSFANLESQRMKDFRHTLSYILRRKTTCVRVSYVRKRAEDLRCILSSTIV